MTKSKQIKFADQGISQWCVRSFFKWFGKPERQPLNSPATRLNIKLMDEEFSELTDEAWNCLIQDKITPNLLKEIGDLRYVISNFTTNLGIDEDRCVLMVHESNMSKLGDDGKPILRTDGKILKGPYYREPDFTEYAKELNDAMRRETST